jgi:hypothetical protein
VKVEIWHDGSMTRCGDASSERLDLEKKIALSARGRGESVHLTFHPVVVIGGGHQNGRSWRNQLHNGTRNIFAVSPPLHISTI